jgi:hypothetical protein
LAAIPFFVMIVIGIDFMHSKNFLLVTATKKIYIEWFEATKSWCKIVENLHANINNGDAPCIITWHKEMPELIDV